MDGMKWLKTILRCERKSASCLSHAIVFFAWCLFLGCIGVLGYQIFFWLKNGQWVSIPAKLIFIRAVPDSAIIWVRDETTWIGLKKVLVLIAQAPLSLFLFIGALVLWCIGYKGEELSKKKGEIKSE